MLYTAYIIRSFHSCPETTLTHVKGQAYTVHAHNYLHQALY